jgi:L-2-hydroxyglutarate oxidase LhgO
MDRVDCVVIGAGVVGLAVARQLVAQGLDVLVLERHDGFGRETSSRNSEVIHAGMYYRTGSLKAELCIKGNRLLYDFCASRGIPHRRVGKLIIAAEQDEMRQIEGLFSQGRENDVPDLRMLTSIEAQGVEGRVECAAALWSGTTGIIDTHSLMKCLESDIASRGGVVAYNCSVTSIGRDTSGFMVEVQEAGMGASVISCDTLVNSAGLSSDHVAELAGIDVDAEGYRLHPCKGEYFSLSGRFRNAFQHLIYPPPEQAGLGVHIVMNLEGMVRLGPNAEYVSTVDYTVNPAHAPEFFQAARRYLPSLEPADLSPDTAGIRPKLQGPGDSFRDFVIMEESGRGFPGFVNLIGIESPGLTACLAISEIVGSMVKFLR